jgi:hypothetical protein
MSLRALCVEKPEVADAHEAFGQNMQEEAPSGTHMPLASSSFSCFRARILPTEGDAAIRNRKDAVIGDGRAMSIAGQVAQNPWRTEAWCRRPTRGSTPDSGAHRNGLCFPVRPAGVMFTRTPLPTGPAACVSRPTGLEPLAHMASALEKPYSPNAFRLDCVRNGGAPPPLCKLRLRF